MYSAGIPQIIHHSVMYITSRQSLNVQLWMNHCFLGTLKVM